MNEEEKKAVFYLKDLENDKEYLIIEQRQAITTILNLIEKQQKELEPIKKLNIPVETLVSEFNRLEDLEDNTEMLKMKLKKQNAVIDKMAEHIEKGCDFDNRTQTKRQILEYFTNLVEKESK